MQRPPLLEVDGFCFWKSRFKTFVKSKDIDLWQVIQNGDFYFEVEDSEMKLMKETLYELLKDEQNKQLSKNNEAKMTLYNALPHKEYARVFMCKTAKEIWHTLIITHQGNSQVKNFKIDLLTREYEKFLISNEETFDSGFTRFDVSLKILSQTKKVKYIIKFNAEAIHMILNRIKDNTHSIVDALSSAKGMWEAIERLQQEPDEQELEAHYMYMAKIQEVLHAADDNSGSTYDAEPLKRNVIYDSSNMCDDEAKADQNVGKPEDERVVLAFLIANLKLDVDENKMKHKQLNKSNMSLSQELEKSKQDIFYCRSELEKYKIFQTNHKDKEKAKLERAKALGLLAKAKRLHNEYSKTQSYETFCVKE
uniref:Coiled-coil domain-containing protein 186-like n=1 Tax=Tanacetum cinerariifolium TaxID=118510 RepID=A0A6L2J1M5_TANCI|nr:coiled-coil domain-containing protein 186-like [Tanacetum cinerariifolium]